VEKALAASVQAEAVRKVSEALEGVGGLQALAEAMQGPLAVGDVAKLLPAMRAVAKLADDADLPIPISARLDAAVDGLVDEGAAEVEQAAIRRLADVVREAAQALRLAKGNAELALEGERERLAESAALADTKELAAVERHRGRLARAIEVELRVLRLIREVARPEDGAPGPLVQPFLVEVRVLGRGRLE
jgi:hypothetical protein